MKRAIALAGLAIVAALGIAWVLMAPPQGVEIPGPYVMAPDNARFDELRASADAVPESVQHLATQIRGYDEIVLREELGLAFVTAMDGRIWKLALDTGTAEPFADPPLMAAGARLLPGTDTLVFCAARLSGASYPEDEVPGLYALDLASGAISPLLLRVPVPPAGPAEQVFAVARRPSLRLDAMTDANSRPVAFCNDLDVSRDGQRIYFSEPFAYPGASMGAGAYPEGVSLGQHGRLWLYDRARAEVSLVAQNFAFVDGVLLEHDGHGAETSVLITETPKFRIGRVHLSEGGFEEVWNSLPGMPDGLDRDAQGRIWIGLLKERSALATWVHANPWIKPLLLRLPPAWIPQSHRTGILALSEDASKVLYYGQHDGSRVGEISVVVPGRDHLYLPSFTDRTPGVHRIPYPLTR